MILEQAWAQKRMLWAFEKSIFQLFACFWVTKLRPFSGKVRQSAKIYLNQNLGIRTLLENNFWTNVELKNECCEPLKRAFFSFLQLFERRSWNHFLGKWSNVLKNLFKSNLGIRIFLENGFGATLSTKTNVVMFWKEYFSVFCKFLSDKAETVFRESEAMLQNVSR